MEAYSSISAGSILGCSCAREINRQLTPQWRTPITVLKWIGHLCFSMVLSSALLTQRPVGRKNQRLGTKQRKQCNRIQEWQNLCVCGKVFAGSEGEWDRWLLLYPKTGIPKIHAQSKASLWKFPPGHAPRVASVLCNLGFFQTLVLFSHCPCVASFCLFWRPFCHFFTSSRGLDFFLLRVVEHHFFGMVGCFFIIARNLSPFNRFWMVPLYHARPYNNKPPSPQWR